MMKKEVFISNGLNKILQFLAHYQIAEQNLNKQQRLLKAFIQKMNRQPRCKGVICCVLIFNTVQEALIMTYLM